MYPSRSVMIHCWSSCSCTLNPSVSPHTGEHLAQLVFRSENSASLWSLKAIHAMCEMEQARVRSVLLIPSSHPLSASSFTRHLSVFSDFVMPGEKFRNTIYVLYFTWNVFCSCWSRFAPRLSSRTCVMWGERLREHPKVAAVRAGLWGITWLCWLMPLAAAASPQTRYCSALLR